MRQEEILRKVSHLADYTPAILRQEIKKRDGDDRIVFFADLYPKKKKRFVKEIRF